MLRKLRQFFQGRRRREADDFPPQYPPAAVYAFHLCERGAYDEAEVYCRQASEADPQNPWAYDATGLVCLERQMNEEALVAFDRAIDLLPSCELFTVHRGTVLHRLGRDRDAMEGAERLAALRPKSPSAQRHLATAFANCHEYERAIASLKHAMSLDSKGVKDLEDLGKIARSVGETRDAISYFKSALSASPVSVASGLELGELLVSVGESEAGERVYRQIAETAHMSADDSYSMGLYLERRGRRDDALKVFEEMTQRYPVDLLGWASVARILAGKGNIQDADKYLKKALALFPDHSGVIDMARRLSAAKQTGLPALERASHLPREKKRPPTDDMIVIRGGLELSYVRVIQHYRREHPETFIVLSSWADTPSTVLDALDGYVDEIVLNPRPASPGINNINFQIVCAANGVTRAIELGAKRILLTRTDVAFLTKDILRRMKAELRAHDTSVARGRGLDGRLLISDAFTLMRPFYHISDIFMFGAAEDVNKFWSLDSITEKCLRPESLLARAFAGRIGRPLSNEARDSLAFCREHFIVKNTAWFGFFWLKNPCYLPISYTIDEQLWADS